ncbi:response regulator [Cohnella suwonensis]|uniref:Response regulator n=1 Tax=Cohnella suwonensis TaxID=696072 RepID=A0ABW0LTY2_9BACL
MKVILLDDEPLALRSLEAQLGKIDGIEIVGSFINPVEALAQAGSLKPDAAFVDIDMPQLSGLEFADKLLDMDESVAVVFVTAYDDYAIKAFELNALDYLLKPVYPDRLALTVSRLEKQIVPGTVAAGYEASQSSVKAAVRCCPSLVVADGHGEALSWRTAKAKELFAYMIHKRGQPVRKETLLELLWPDVDEKKGYAQMYTAIYRLRKSFEHSGLGIELVNSGDGYLLKADGVSVDSSEWEKELRAIGELDDGTEGRHALSFAAYPGDYLSEHDYGWAEGERQRLRNLRYRHGMELCRYWSESDRGKEAADAYEKLLTEFPYAEEIYEALIDLYDREGFGSLAMRHYEELENMLRTEFGEEPSEAALQLYERLRAKS